MTYATYMYTADSVDPERLFAAARQAVGIPPTVEIINTTEWRRRWGYPNRAGIESAICDADAAVKMDIERDGFTERRHVDDCPEWQLGECDCPILFEWRLCLVLHSGHAPGNEARHERYVNEITRATGAAFYVEVSY